MERISNITLCDDSPKACTADDLLGYANFAEKIAKTVTNINAPNGYVIGINGAWGSGKSTVLNFVAEYIHKSNSERSDTSLIHIDFRPWIVAGHHDLISSFFKVLSEKLGPKTTDPCSWLKYHHKTVSGASNALVDAAATVAITVDPSSGVMSRIGRDITKESFSNVIGRYLKEPSLQKTYENLRKQLIDSQKRVLVTIDDIDRLEDAEIKSIMRMVKSIGQLPNVIYLLSYDREIVWEVLDGNANRAGSSFGEKLVQQELDLPKPPKSTLLKMLDREILFLIGNKELSYRWLILLRDGINRWIKTPRDVVRLSNAVKFSWPALCDEIDPQDLLAMEGLRLFDSEAFVWLRDNRSFLFNDDQLPLPKEDIQKEAMENFNERIAKDRRSQVLSIVTTLFPQLENWLGGNKYYSVESINEVEKRRGIGCEAGYESYFGLHPSPDAVRVSDLNKMLSKNFGAEDIERIIKRYLTETDSRGDPMISKVLHEINIHYLGNTRAEATTEMLCALFRVGEEIINIDHENTMFEFSPRILIGFLIHDVLSQWGVERAGKNLIEIFKKEGSTAFLADVYVWRGEELGIFQNTSRDSPCISPEDFQSLGTVIIEKINEGYEDGTLASAPYYFNILKSWIQLSNGVQAKSWLNDGISLDGKFMAKACIGILAYRVGNNGRHYSMREQPDPALYELENLIVAGGKHLEKSNLTEDERRRITATVDGVKKFLESDIEGSKPSTDK